MWWDMNEYLAIKNFEKYQHYTKRNPPWIKLYYELLDDDEFISLSIASRHHYMTLLMIAGKKNNRIPHDVIYLRKVMRLDETPDITELLSSGFLIASRKHYAIKLPRKLRQNALSETETETETETDNSETQAEAETKIAAALKLPTANGVETWTRYSEAYRGRYGVEPVRNQQVNSMLKKFVEKLGYKSAPLVAAFYLTHHSAFYVAKRHPVNLLLADAEGLHTQWKSGESVTQSQATMIDKTGARLNVFKELIAEKEAAKHERTRS